MGIARSFHLVPFALLPAVVLAACESTPVLPAAGPSRAPTSAAGGNGQPEPQAAGPQTGGSPPLPTAGIRVDQPSGAVPLSRGDLAFQVVFPAGSYLKLRSLGIKAAVTPAELSETDVRQLRFTIDGKLVTADQVEILSMTWDEQGRLILKARLKGAAAKAPATLSVATTNGAVVLLGDITDKPSGELTLSVESTARSLIQAMLRGLNRQDLIVPESIYQLVADRLSMLIISSLTTSLLDAPSLQGLLDALADLVASGQILDAPQVVTRLAAINDAGKATTGLALRSVDFAGPLLPYLVLGTNYRYSGSARSPEFSWSSGLKAQSYVLVMEDRTNPQVNWLVYDIPSSVTQLSRGASNSLPSGAKMGLGGQAPGAYRGDATYVAPAPLPGQFHAYRATLYALEVPTLAVPANPDLMAVQAAMAGKVFGSAGVDALFGIDVSSAGGSATLVAE